MIKKIKSSCSGICPNCGYAMESKVGHFSCNVKHAQLTVAGTCGLVGLLRCYACYSSYCEKHLKELVPGAKIFDGTTGFVKFDYLGYYALNEIVSQKAKGIRVIQNRLRGGLSADSIQVSYLFQTTAQRIKDMKIASTYESTLQEAIDNWRAFHNDARAFVRPCPSKPRHGFVDSREISLKSIDALNEVIDQILAAGEESIEILWTLKSPCTYSALATPQSLTIGPGNEGSTSGNECVTLRFGLTHHDFLSGFFHGDIDKLGRQAHIDHTPYVELLRHKHGYTEVVQLRDGPQVPMTANFVPETVTVSRVVDPAGVDLLEWETIAKNLQDGEVVYQKGGSLTNHYAVHSILNNVPYLTEEEPKVGDVLRKNQSDSNKLTNKDYANVARFTLACLRDSIGSMKDEFMTGVGCLHSTGLWVTNGTLKEVPVQKLVARGFTSLFRMSAALCFGELRHWDSCGPSGDLALDCELPDDRDNVYEMFCEPGNLEVLVRNLYPAIDAFKTRGWGSSYGGKKWGKCTQASFNLGVALLKFMDEPKASTFTDLGSMANMLVNQVHNGGNLFNKIASIGDLDSAAINPMTLFINSRTYLALRETDISVPRLMKKQVFMLSQEVKRGELRIKAKLVPISFTKKTCPMINKVANKKPYSTTPPNTKIYASMNYNGQRIPFVLSKKGPMSLGLKAFMEKHGKATVVSDYVPSPHSVCDCQWCKDTSDAPKLPPATVWRDARITKIKVFRTGRIALYSGNKLIADGTLTEHDDNIIFKEVIQKERKELELRIIGKVA